MNYFNKNKTISIILVLLLIINITALVTIFVQRHGPIIATKPSKQDDIERTTHFLKNEFQFNDLQVKKFMDLQENYMLETEQYKQKIGDAKFKLYGNILENETSTNNPDQLYAIISNNTALIEKRTVKFLSELKSLCTEEQIDKYEMLMAQILMRISPEHRPPEDHRGPPPHRNGKPGERPLPPPHKRNNN
jgi:hypothetical protein